VPKKVSTEEKERERERMKKKRKEKRKKKRVRVNQHARHGSKAALGARLQAIALHLGRYHPSSLALAYACKALA
jgi:hypothetical protein